MALRVIDADRPESVDRDVADRERVYPAAVVSGWRDVEVDRVAVRAGSPSGSCSTTLVRSPRPSPSARESRPTTRSLAGLANIATTVTSVAWSYRPMARFAGNYQPVRSPTGARRSRRLSCAADDLNRAPGGEPQRVPTLVGLINTRAVAPRLSQAPGLSRARRRRCRFRSRRARTEVGGPDRRDADAAGGSCVQDRRRSLARGGDRSTSSAFRTARWTPARVCAKWLACLLAAGDWRSDTAGAGVGAKCAYGVLRRGRGWPPRSSGFIARAPDRAVGWRAARVSRGGSG